MGISWVGLSEEIIGQEPFGTDCFHHLILQIMLICKHCFLDAEMQSEVEANATSEGACDVL